MVTRDQFVQICRSWIGTPYHLRQHVKGVGADCSTWIAESLIEAGLATHDSLYGGLNVRRGDWFHHISDDVYRQRIMRHAIWVMSTVCRRSSSIQPGCVILQRAAGSRVFNHGGVVTEWPHGIHCLYGGVVEVDVAKDPIWLCKPIEVFDPIV